MSKCTETVTKVSPWEFAIQDHQTIADRKDQAFGRILRNWYKSIDVKRAPKGMQEKEADVVNVETTDAT